MNNEIANKWVNRSKMLGINIEHILTKEECELFWNHCHEKHLSGATISELAKEFNLTLNTFTLNFKKRGWCIINYNNQLSVRNNLFETIDSEEDAYWLGFIYADGYISDKGGFELGLKLSDVKHLEKFARYCGYSKIVKTDSYRCRVSFKTQELKARFNSLGIIPRKSLILTYPTFLNSNLQKHFIRGYFDGDGCINQYQTKHYKPYFLTNLLGTRDFLEGVIKNANLKSVSLYKHGNIWSFTLTRSKAIDFANFMYKDSKVYLDRKYEIYNKFCRLTE